MALAQDIWVKDYHTSIGPEAHLGQDIHGKNSSAFWHNHIVYFGACLMHCHTDLWMYHSIAAWHGMVHTAEDAPWHGATASLPAPARWSHC